MAEILLIDDMAGVRRAASSILKTAGHQVVTAEDGSQGFDLIKQHNFDLVITDMRMPTLDGVQMLAELNALPSRPPVIAMSGGGAGAQARAALQSMKDNSDAFLEKPFEKEELLAAVGRLLGAAG